MCRTLINFKVFLPVDFLQWLEISVLNPCSINSRIVYFFEIWRIWPIVILQKSRILYRINPSNNKNYCTIFVPYKSDKFRKNIYARLTDGYGTHYPLPISLNGHWLMYRLSKLLDVSQDLYCICLDIDLRYT